MNSISPFDNCHSVAFFIPVRRKSGRDATPKKINNMEEETIFEQTYTPDWANIPAGFDWVAVDSDGEVFAFEKKPDIRWDFWVNISMTKICKSLGFIEAPPGDTWKTMIYERPKNVAA